MKTNGCVTVYRFDEDTEVYERLFYPRAWVAYVPGEAQDVRGAKDADVLRVRIPGRLGGAFAVGDLIFPGEGGERPDKTVCLRIVALRDNGVGRAKHVRIDAR